MMSISQVYSERSEAFGISSVGQIRANSWEFPLLAKYYLSRRHFPFRFFMSGGYVLRHLSDVESVFLRENPVHGVAGGGGLRLRVGPLRLAPEIRYTRWRGRPFDEQGSRGFFLRSAQNQVDLLLAVTF